VIVGAYVLHLYCRYAPQSEQKLAKDRAFDARHYGGMGEFGGETAGQARRAARRAGWRFRKGDVTCPTCVASGPGIRPVAKERP
jgi:hypothetical protein